MTFDEFLEALAAAPIKWYLFNEYQHSIRGRKSKRGQQHCPISAVTGDHHDLASPRRAAVDKLKMNGSLASDIVHSADNTEHSLDYIRQALLKACKLEEAQ